MSKQVVRFLRTTNATTMTQSQRTATRAAALAWLVQLADRRQASLFDLRPAENALLTATNETDLAESATFALGAIATPTAQAKLFEIGAAPSRPAPIRERALSMLAAHMQRHGIMLTELQTEELRKAANQETDAKLQLALAATLGSLNPNLARTSDVLKALPRREVKPAE